MLHICTPEPYLESSGERRREIHGREAVLLRVLLLAPRTPFSDEAPRVPVDAAIAAMGVAKNSFGRYVTYLRESLGDPRLVKRSDGTIQFAGDFSATDVATIKATYAEVVTLASEGATVTRSIAEQLLPLLERIVGLYGGTPAMGLDAIGTKGLRDDVAIWVASLDDVVSEWVDLWMQVQLLRAECLLTSNVKADGKRVAQDLLKIARTKDPPVEVWPRLLRAAQLSGDLRTHRRAWDLTERFHQAEDLPLSEELADLAPPTPQPPDDVVHPHRSTVLDRPLEGRREERDPRIELADVLGITTASALQLRDSNMEPADCIERTDHRLFFSGILASKWVMEPAIRADFVDLLERLDDPDGEPGDVRFLVIDPAGDAYQRLHQMRGGRLSDESVPHLRRLASKYQCFEVRVVDALPAFRIIVIDDDVVTFSTYALEEEPYATSRHGWAAPHVILDPIAPFPLASAFRLYFEERWASAKPL